jgi:hypothetical protein
MVTQIEIAEQLERLKNKERPYFKPQSYKEFMPHQIPNLPDRADTSMLASQVEAIMNASRTATQTETIKAQNRADYLAMKEAQEKLARAKRQLKIAKSQKDNNYWKPGKQQQSPQQGGSVNVPRGKFKDTTPFNINSGLGTYNWRGRSLTVNRSMANNFIGFLNALARTGYKIHSLGSYANRNIAGTNTPSLHSRGLAIDINPAQNPVTWNGVNVTDLPKGVGRLAAKYGLLWGGNWTGSKRDPMHFSKPYSGVY